MDKKKLRVRVHPVPVESVTSKYYETSVIKVATSLKVDNDFVFMSKINHDGSVNLCASQTYKVGTGESILVDCGFSLTIQKGYKIAVKPLVSGLFVSMPSEPSERMIVNVFNCCSELIDVEKGVPFATMSVEPIYFFEWE